MKFEFTLRFEGKTKSLSKDDGLTIEQLSELLSSMHKAIQPGDKEKIVLNEIRGNCYALNVVTNNEPLYHKLVVVHRNIQDGKYDTLNKFQRQYASKMKAIIGNELTLQCYSPHDTSRLNLSEITVPEIPEFYYEISEEVGIITAIGGRILDGKSYVSLDSVHHQFKINSIQEKELIKHFKKNKIRLTVKNKIEIESGEVKSSEVLDFDVVSSVSFQESVIRFRTKYPDAFENEDN